VVSAGGIIKGELFCGWGGSAVPAMNGKIKGYQVVIKVVFVLK